MSGPLMIVSYLLCLISTAVCGSEKWKNDTTELVFIVSGSAKFGGDKGQKYHKGITDMIKILSLQLSDQNMRTAALFGRSDENIEIISEMTTIHNMHQYVDMFFAQGYVQTKMESSGLANVINYADQNMFSTENKGNQSRVAIILVHHDLETEDINDFLRDICTKIITFVVIYPKPHQTCSGESVQRTTTYINMLLNYTKLLDEKQAMCTDDIKQIDFEVAVQQAVEINAEVQSYCQRHPDLRTLDDTGLLKCKGFFCRDNPALWACAILLAIFITVLVLTAVRIYVQFIKSHPMDYYSFLGEALAYHQEFVMAQSQCLYGSSFFQELPTIAENTKEPEVENDSSKRAKARKSISYGPSEAHSNATSASSTPRKRSVSASLSRGRIVSRKTSSSKQSSRRTSPSSGTPKSTPPAQTPRIRKHSAPNSRSASVGSRKYSSPAVISTQRAEKSIKNDDIKVSKSRIRAAKPPKKPFPLKTAAGDLATNANPRKLLKKQKSSYEFQKPPKATVAKLRRYSLQTTIMQSPLKRNIIKNSVKEPEHKPTDVPKDEPVEITDAKDDTGKNNKAESSVNLRIESETSDQDELENISEGSSEAVI